MTIVDLERDSANLEQAQMALTAYSVQNGSKILEKFVQPLFLFFDWFFRMILIDFERSDQKLLSPKKWEREVSCDTPRSLGFPHQPFS